MVIQRSSFPEMRVCHSFCGSFPPHRFSSPSLKLLVSGKPCSFPESPWAHRCFLKRRCYHFPPRAELPVNYPLFLCVSFWCGECVPDVWALSNCLKEVQQHKLRMTIEWWRSHIVHYHFKVNAMPLNAGVCSLKKEISIKRKQYAFWMKTMEKCEYHC